MHILNLEHSLRRFSDSTIVPDTEHDLKTNDTARFHKKSANKYEELKIVFISIIPWVFHFNMDQNN